MNIKEAKVQIKQAVNAYRVKNDVGEPLIPIEKQRPIFLIGAPGIGKTAIMEQIAQELGIGLVSYSMTHHTRQSALGLPYIVHKTYRGNEYEVSEYTMSEIIASVYEIIENDKKDEGILFLDEINCVSETLAPSMLQFLQYKKFGQHKVPDGWIIVTAGNPPEFNNSVREFDIVTWDRVKRIDVEADYEVWKEYAISVNTHPAILAYLEVKGADFYRIETTIDGKRFVTARGWSDLSEMIKIYESLGYPDDERLIIQYIQNIEIAKAFATYYDLFIKYKKDFQVDAILRGIYSKETEKLAKEARFDERISLLSLMLDMVGESTDNCMLLEDKIALLMKTIIENKEDLKNDESIINRLLQISQKINESIASGRRTKSIRESSLNAKKYAADFFSHVAEELNQKAEQNWDMASEIIKREFNKENEFLKKNVEQSRAMLDNMFSFCEKVYPDGRELLLLVTELTYRPNAVRFIGKYGCDSYFKYSKEMMLSERKIEITRQINELDLGELL